METDKDLLLHSLYRPNVKISNWFVSDMALPFDNKDCSRTSHYKAFGMEKYTTPISVTKSTFVVSPLQKVPLESRFVNGVPNIPELDSSADKIQNRVIRPDRARKKIEMISTYRRDYESKVPKSTKKDCCQDEPLDFLFNRIPKNDFVMDPTAASKFMDDGIAYISEGRSRINFMRQIRNTHR